MSILNVITQILAYDDNVGSTDNPCQREFDWTRKYNGLTIDNAVSDKKTVAPGASLTLFDGSRSTALTFSSILSLSLISPSTSSYRLAVTFGPSAFRSARAVSGITGATVTINNGAVAVFAFAGATLSSVQVGDTMRINGALQYDQGPYAFNPINSGLWTVIGVSGTSISAVRPVGQSFSGASETVASAASDVQFYSAAGVQVGDNIDISGTFSPVSQRAYVVQAVTPSTIDFVSSVPLPDESGLAYVPGTISVYTNLKRFMYIEVDQEAVVQMNGETGMTNKITPISAGDPSLPGYFHKLGETYSCVIINRSVNPMNVKYCLGE